jgi:RNA polymerase-binding transcription factor DksA
MSKFTPQQRKEFRGAMNARAAVLREEIAADAREDLNAEPEMAALQRDIEELRDIEEALARLDKPAFGLCEDCGDDIAFLRLQATPAAKRCSTCQSKFERT